MNAMTTSPPDLDLDTPAWVVLLLCAGVLWALAALIGRRERRGRVRLIVVVTERREDGTPDDGPLDEQGQHDEHDAQDQSERERQADVLRNDHGASVPVGILRFDPPVTRQEAAEYQRRWMERQHG